MYGKTLTSVMVINTVSRKTISDTMTERSTRNIVDFLNAWNRTMNDRMFPASPRMQQTPVTQMPVMLVNDSSSSISVLLPVAPPVSHIVVFMVTRRWGWQRSEWRVVTVSVHVTIDVMCQTWKKQCSCFIGCYKCREKVSFARLKDYVSVMNW